MILTKYGKKEWGMALAAFFGVSGLSIASVFLGILTPGIMLAVIAFAALACFAVCAFFRDPPRKVAADPSAIVSPADGTIRDVELIKSETLECDELRRLFHDKDILRMVTDFVGESGEVPCVRRGMGAGKRIQNRVKRRVQHVQNAVVNIPC